MRPAGFQYPGYDNYSSSSHSHSVNGSPEQNHITALNTGEIKAQPSIVSSTGKGFERSAFENKSQLDCRSRAGSSTHIDTASKSSSKKN